MKSKRIVVYTAVCDDYDILRDPEYVNRECDYVCFCDRPSLGTSVWRRQPFDRYFSDPTRTARRVKLLPHLYFRDYEISIWIDGNITIVGDIVQLVNRCLADAPIAMYAHPEGRTCIYKEGDACLQQKKDDPAVIHAQLEHYKNQGYPQEAGLYASYIIFRRHGDPLVIRTMEDWWRELLAFSRRDQLSFNYVADKNHIKVATIQGNIWTENNPHFRYNAHSTAPRPKVRRLMPHPGEIRSPMIPSPTYQRTVDLESGDSLSKLATWIKPGSSVLELGPATGYFTQYLKEKLGCTVDCVEISEKMAATAAPHARTMWVADLDEITLSDRFTEGSYDYVIAADVLEHLKNPWRTITMCRSMLKPTGQILVSLPNIGHAALLADILEGNFDYRPEGLLDRTHLRFFTRRSMLDLFRRGGYRIETVDTVVQAPERTEFQTKLEELPPRLRSYLLKHKDALTYQFIVAATPGEMSDAEWQELGSSSEPAQPYFRTQVFWAAEGEPFAEERSVSLYPLLGYDRQRLQFELPNAAEVARLRFDPADRPGYVHLSHLRLIQGNVAAEGGSASVLLSLDTPHEIAKAAQFEGICFCPSALGDTFVAVTEDPQLTIELNQIVRSEPDGPLSLEVVLSWPISADYVAACAQFNKISEDYRGGLASLAQKTETIRTLETEIEKARTYQAKLESQIAVLRLEIDQAREYQANLERQIAVLRRPRVDVMVVNYNGDRWIDGFMDSLRRASYPAEHLRLIFVDNGSADDSLEHARRRAAELPFPATFVPTSGNAGFTGGYARAFEYGDAEYYFVINADTVMAPDAIDRLIDVLEADPKVGIAEARQSPLEHPKYFDALTGETSWCSGACMMVREKALRSIGGGFDPSFFMYAEDVDLSWRMWLHGWKCVYVREAVVEHFTEHLDPTRDHNIQHYFSMRNGALMRVIYGSRLEAVLHYAAMLRVGMLSRNPRGHKWLTLKAMIASLKRLRGALRKRRALQRLGRHTWVFFNGWLYGRHARDPALTATADDACITDLVASWTAARRELSHDLPLDQHIVRIPAVHVGGEKRSAILAYHSSRLHYQLAIPPDTVLTGSIAAPPDVWKPTARGCFDILRDGESLWRQELSLGNLAHRRWVPFEIALPPTCQGTESRITLCFDGQQDLAWGLWGDVRLARVERKPDREDWLESLTGLAVSVVIPTHNRAQRVGRVIHRLMAQDLPRLRYEVILVDSNSTDDTPAVAATLARRYPNLQTLRCEQPGAAAARNMGMEAAQGGLIVLLDDDILVGESFLRQVLRARQDHPGRVLLGRILAPWEGACDPFHRYLLQVQDVNIYNFPDELNVPANYFYTACVAIPREVLADKRFDEGFRVYGVEDIEFGFRLLSDPVEMVFLPELRVLHDYYPTFRAYRRKKHKAGYSLGYFLAQHPEHAHRFQFGRRFRRYYHVLRVMRTLGAPVAGILYLAERLLYREGSVNRLLYWWLYTDLRIQLYSGLRRYQRGAPPP